MSLQHTQHHPGKHPCLVDTSHLPMSAWLQESHSDPHAALGSRYQSPEPPDP